MQQGLLPLFPLQVVLFPGALLPLHIFEERYKEMIGEALRDQSEFGIVFAGDTGVAEVGCTAVIEKVLQEYPDGRIDILTVGRRRFEILLVNEERSFLRGAVEFFGDEDSQLSIAELETCAEAYNRLMTLEGHPQLEEDAIRQAYVSFRLAQPINDAPFRQELLRMRSEAERITRLADFLPRYVAERTYQARMKDVAPRNGHGHLKH